MFYHVLIPPSFFFFFPFFSAPFRLLLPLVGVPHAFGLVDHAVDLGVAEPAAGADGDGLLLAWPSGKAGKKNLFGALVFLVFVLVCIFFGGGVQLEMAFGSVLCVCCGVLVGFIYFFGGLCFESETETKQNNVDSLYSTYKNQTVQRNTERGVGL